MRRLDRLRICAGDQRLRGDFFGIATFWCSARFTYCTNVSNWPPARGLSYHQVGQQASTPPRRLRQSITETPRNAVSHGRRDVCHCGSRSGVPTRWRGRWLAAAGPLPPSASLSMPLPVHSSLLPPIGVVPCTLVRVLSVQLEPVGLARNGSLVGFQAYCSNSQTLYPNESCRRTLPALEENQEVSALEKAQSVPRTSSRRP